MFCRNCGNEVDEKAVACMKCGHNPKTGSKHCPNCGVAVELGQIVCVKCGGALASGQDVVMSDQVLEPKDKTRYLLLAIFLGGLGIHNFYAGYTNRAVLQLLISLVGGIFTCGLAPIGVWIWAIVEGVNVDKDAFGNPFVKGSSL